MFTVLSVQKHETSWSGRTYNNFDFYCRDRKVISCRSSVAVAVYLDGVEYHRCKCGDLPDDIIAHRPMQIDFWMNHLDELVALDIYLTSSSDGGKGVAK